MWLKWLPWRLVVSRVAQAHGFIDPMSVLARLHRFAQPSEVAEPIELLRAGVAFHARGLINSRAIQHNLDWVWPMWVERQFDPSDVAFVPRAFSITHINLTHRNWTAVGQPDLDWTPIVDPHGLVTPHYDGWSLDAWIVGDDGHTLVPSRTRSVEQDLALDGTLRVRTRVAGPAGRLEQRVDVVGTESPRCRVRVDASGAGDGWLVLSVRPSNPEGVSFVHEIEQTADDVLLVNEDHEARFDTPIESLRLSDYRRGDVFGRLDRADDSRKVACDVGLATAAAMFRLEAGAVRSIEVELPPAADDAPLRTTTGSTSWTTALDGRCVLEAPDERTVELFDLAIAGLVLHAPELVYPGPYTYRRFWFRDAAFLLDALLAAALPERVERAIRHFPDHQTPLGYFHSQDGEWDSNGEALWIIERYHRCTGATPTPELMQSVRRGAAWIVRKRLSDTLPEPHAGLMPAGFSAEHLGPNDFYYWDDFWSAAGLRAAAALVAKDGDRGQADPWLEQMRRLLEAVDRSLTHPSRDTRRPGVPASPYRRMDAGAIGSLAADYPLQLWPAGDRRMLDTVEFLLDRCTHEGGFFQDMIHSGINPYLTLHMAQVLLRADDPRAWPLVETVRDLASPTGQWPEAIHPHTLGGCMGDGQHLWAAAEWVLAIRNCFVREEGERLVIGAGLPAAWLDAGSPLRLGPTLTRHGAVTVEVLAGPNTGERTVRWDGRWCGPAPSVEVRLPSASPVVAADDASAVTVTLTAGTALTAEART